METHKYKNPPLTEAVFELFFKSTDWTPITVGEFYNLVKPDFPISKSQNSPGVGFSLGPQGVFNIANNNEAVARFENKAGNEIIQLSSSMLTVNKLPRYSSWSDYLKLILKVVKAFNGTVKVSSINHIGLRFINEIDVKSHTLDNIKEHFNYYPCINNAEGGVRTAIQMITEFDDKHNGGINALYLTTQNPKKGVEAPVRFEFQQMQRRGAALDNVDVWLGNAHKSLHELFINCLTKKSLEGFDDVR